MSLEVHQKGLAVSQRLARQDRQQQLADAARKIITAKGMERLTIGALAKEMGLSEGAIYRHVRSKKEILLLVMEDIERTLLLAVARAANGAVSPLEKLESVLQAHLSYVERRRGVSFLVLNEALRLGDRELRQRAAAVLESYLGGVQRLLEEGQAAGVVRKDLDVQVAARLFLGMVQSNVMLWALNSHSFPLAKGHEAMWALYSAAVADDRSGRVSAALGNQA